VISAEVVIARNRLHIDGRSAALFRTYRTIERALDQTVRAQTRWAVGFQFRFALRASWHFGRFRRSYQSCNGRGFSDRPHGPRTLAGNRAFATGQLNGTVYETDGSNNLYTINTTTGAALLIGPTGLPQCPSVTDPDDIGEGALFSANGKLYLTFDGFNAVTNAVVDAPEFYEVNPLTGAATLIGSTAFGIDAALQVNGVVYGFTSDNTVLTLNVANGNTTFVTNYDAAAFDTLGAAPTPEPASFGLVAMGITATLVAGRRRFHGRQG
jgi:hypothetical protein